MPPLALVVCPLPADREVVRATQSLLAELAGRDDVVLFCPEPYQAPAAWERAHRLLPLAELPYERARGAVTAPIYLVDGGPGDGLLRRTAASVPGVMVEAATTPTATSLRARAAAITAMPQVRDAAAAPTVEAMVLAYKSKDYISPCLQSLLEQDWPNLKITVLDNASGDGTADFVRRTFPGIEVLESDENLGFAAGHNLLFDRSTADYVALLNHDAIARRNWVSELVAAAESLPGGAAFGAKMLMRRCPTILNSTGIVMCESGFAADRDIGRPDLDPATEPERVFAVCGGALLLRGPLLRQLGGFDPTFFMYVEDVDWCWRARIAGHEVYYVPSAVAVHDWHGDMAAAGKTSAPEAEEVVAEREGRRRAMVERNRLQAVFKNYERHQLRRVWRGIRDYDRGRLEALAEHVTKGGGPMPRRVLEAVQSAHRWCRRHALGLRWRRFRTQRLRAVPDATFTDLIVPGMQEPSGVGDLHAIVDRYCAKPRARIAVGGDDAGSLGPGWHHPEPGAHGHEGLRWTMAKCWFYVAAAKPWRTVALTLVPQPLDTWAELWVDGICVGRQDVPRDRPNELRWQLPAESPADRVIECSLVCGAFVPKERGMGGDTRELGLHVAVIHVE
ncbi:MAG: glycosyltransferase family 2 protein [Planctomycetes bacterium]|nr:glycosyltransferase family 2 protein [Planctomycetota bacterium]